MRNETLPNILAQMENKDYIKQVEKKTIKGIEDGETCSEELNQYGWCSTPSEETCEIVTTNDKLFLPSYTEVSGESWSEGIQYKYFKISDNSILKKSPYTNSGISWWTCTPHVDYPTWFVVIDEYGSRNGFSAYMDIFAICPAFVIG